MSRKATLFTNCREEDFSEVGKCLWFGECRYWRYRPASSGNGDAGLNPEEIESCFSNAGWHIDGGFEDYLVIGCDNDRLSILAYGEALQTDDPIFELIEHERNVTYGVPQISTPQQAAQLLREHGQPPEEEEEEDE